MLYLFLPLILKLDVVLFMADSGMFDPRGQMWNQCFFPIRPNFRHTLLRVRGKCAVRWTHPYLTRVNLEVLILEKRVAV